MPSGERGLALTALAVVCVVGAGVWRPAAAQDHAGRYDRLAIEAGLRVYGTLCSQCHGPNGDMVSGIDLRRGLFRRASSDEDLARAIRTGSPAAGMPPFDLQASELAGIVAYIRAGFDATATVTVGDAARGRRLFDGAGACGTCHRVNGRGPRVAPDLTDVGLARTPAAIQRSLMDPTSAMLPINRPVRLVMLDGRVTTGRRLNEDTHSVQLVDDQERLRSIPKSEIRTMVVETASPMPSYAGRLTDAEIADLVAYLLTLKDRP
jgi:putative heme-binding domain-containing protein